jgi:FhuF-like iron-sulfur protein
VTRAVPPTAGARLLADLAALGPYFAVDVHRPGSPVRPPWQPLGELTSSPGALACRIGEVRERLAAAARRPADAVEFRVAASIAQLGLCARLLSPALGAAAAGGALPVDAVQARWVPVLGGPFRLSLADTAIAAEPGTDATAEPGTDATAEPGTAAAAALLAGPVTQIVRIVEAMAVSPRVLWGNVASAVNGAATMIAAARPDLAGQAAETAAALLAQPDLADTYQGRPLQGFRRRNCCLIYRLSPERPAYCGDCVLGR